MTDTSTGYDPPAPLQFHTEVDPDEVYGYDVVEGPDGEPEQVPTPEPDDLPFDCAKCVLCDTGIAGYLTEDPETGYERSAWGTCYRGPLGPVCEDCLDVAERAVARVVRSEWLRTPLNILRAVGLVHPREPLARYDLSAIEWLRLAEDGARAVEEAGR